MLCSVLFDPACSVLAGFTWDMHGSVQDGCIAYMVCPAQALLQHTRACNMYLTTAAPGAHQWHVGTDLGKACTFALAQPNLCAGSSLAAFWRGGNCWCVTKNGQLQSEASWL